MPVSHSVRRPVVLALVAALLASLAWMTSSPGTANAAPACAKGDFCLWEHINFQGGRYSWGGSDMNLWNDRFVGGSRDIVAGHSSSAYNNGYRGGYDKVWLYSSFGRLSTCVLPMEDNPGGTFSDFRSAPFWSGGRYRGYSFNINDLVTGYRWATYC
jgi:Peptidase inhibitor family I36